MTEQCIIGARASVMVYDDTQKKWVPSGSSSGLSKVQIYHHQQNNTFRVVGRKLQDHEVVINCSIVKNLKYNQATSTFHQWRDFKYVYGLNFSSPQDAEAFAQAMMRALEVLSGRPMGPTGIMPTNGNPNEEDMGYTTMTREDAAMLQQKLNGSPQTPTSQQNQNNIPQSPPTPQGHHRTSSAPPAPQPPQMSMPPQQQQQQIYNQGGMMPPQIHNGSGMPLPPQGPQQTNPYHAPQQLQQQQHPVYSSQPLNSNYQQNQYHQLIYESSASLSSSSLCSNTVIHNSYLQQPPQNMSNGGVGMPPPQAQAMMHQNGPIYVSSQQQQQQQPPQPPQGPGIPNSASSNSVIYASQQIKPESQGPQPPQPQSNNNYGQTNGHHQIDGVYGQIPVAPPINGMPPLNNGGGNVPVPPPMMNNRSGGGAPAPPAPPAPPMMGGGAPPPPPPPPMMGGGPPAPPAPPMKKEPDAQQDFMGSLAAQLQQAKLKKNKNATPQPNENSGSSTSSGNSAGNYGTIGRSSKGMVSMMDEMAKTLARRRAQVDKKDQPPGEISDDVKQRPWEKSNTLPHKLGSNSSGSNSASNNANGNGSGSESPRPMRKRFGSASEETILKQVNGDGLSIALSDLDSLKAEIVREMRLEIQKAKQEIIEAIKTEFNRR